MKNSFKKESGKMEIKEKLSLLWIVIMFNMAFADIVGFVNPGVLQSILEGTTGIEITQGLLLIFAVLLEIPIAMIFLSRILPYKANRLTNIVASVITILFIIGGGSPHLSYIFLASIETLCMLFIIWYAWKWKNPESQP